MALELYMVGLVVEDMPKALEFYRRLGLAIPEGSEKQPHVEIKMGSGLTFFLHTKKANASYDPEREEALGGYRIILEFYLENRETLETKYAEMINFGYQGHRAPYLTPFGMYFALVKDPDGNTILLSASVEK